MRCAALVTCLILAGCSTDTASSPIEGVMVKLTTCLGPAEATDGFTSAAPDCRRRLADHLAPSTPTAPIHACLYAHDSGRSLGSMPFRWNAPRFEPIESPTFLADATRLDVNFMIFREPIEACDPALWETTCYEAPNCVFRLKGKTSREGDAVVVNFRPRGGGACDVESGPQGGPACQGCGWYSDNEDRPCTPTGQGAEDALPDPICNIETCQWERPRCQAHCQWGPFEICDDQDGCSITPDQAPNACPCGLEGQGTLVCNPETCSLVAQECVGVCVPGDTVLVDEELTGVSAGCGTCNLGQTMAVCSDTCQFQGDTFCDQPDGLCLPGETVGMQVDCEVDELPGFRQPVCGDSCIAEEADPGVCEVTAECGVEVVDSDSGPETEACGRCNLGQRTRECVDGRWGPWSKCREVDIECTPGTLQNLACVNALGACREGTRTQSCNADSCTWGPVSDCSVLPAEEDPPCDGIDADCNGVDYVRDEWDATTRNGNCLSPSVLTVEMLSDRYRPGSDVTIEATNHQGDDYDYYLIDEQLASGCGGRSNCLTVDFETRGAARIAMIYENSAACQRDTSNTFVIWNDLEQPASMELTWPRTGEPFLLRVLSGGVDICGHAYRFTLRMPNQILNDMPIDAEFDEAG